ncbi:hypothetical protein L6452_10491 [Arctium lappa]|uniref:Uncharacterized protein n=1 Tax=Arctium lappa TaxID=4217 RepID=A0ACB9DN39_ARCLA|nr:hypothetical protein L6452_10491 [Arctium lappa]
MNVDKLQPTQKAEGSCEKFRPLDLNLESKWILLIRRLLKIMVLWRLFQRHLSQFTSSTSLLLEPVMILKRTSIAPQQCGVHWPQIAHRELSYTHVMKDVIRNNQRLKQEKKGVARGYPVGCHFDRA